MKIMSINAGSSSLKFRLFEMNTHDVIASGLFERIGIEESSYTIRFRGMVVNQKISLTNHLDAVKILFQKLIELDIIQDLLEIKGVGHRVVSGGDLYHESVLITDEVIQHLIEFAEFAPLHNLVQVASIQACREVLPNIPMVAVFDTAFHQTMTEEHYLYPVPYSWYTDYKVRKYGAHGTSHRYITKMITEELKNPNLKIISCHLGSGGSIAAIKDGKSVDTSMGFTPLAGIMMCTRSGDIDPSILPYIMKKEGKDIDEVIYDLNKRSGLLGLSRYSSDSRDVELGAKEGHPGCVLAEKKFIQSVVSYIAQYYVLLGGIDVLCFTAGIGENSASIRMAIIEALACLGIKIDIERNQVRSELKKISADDSSCLVYVVPTNEEYMIALDTLNFVQ